jgi:ElaB/YqjD/DUF883 family membrane-anchored ribosome-binding protein
MAPRNPELPEGTDHIINGAMETGAGADASTGSSGGGDSAGVDFGAPGGDGGAPIGGGFVAGGGSAPGDDTGGTAVTTTGGGGTEGANSGGGAPVKEQLRDGVQSLKQQATERVRSVADDGKARATTALEDLSRKISEAGSSIDERLGGEYGDYARRAAEAVTGLADTLRDKEVDELWDDARNVVRKSPGVALGIAAVVGFTLARVIKAGIESGGNDRGDVDFTPDGGRNIAFEAEGSGGGSAGTSA